MPRVQKSLMVPDDLYRLIQVIEEKSGATFTRILTAALLSYIFEGTKNADRGTSPGPDHLWMRLAVLIERGDLELADIPLELFNSVIETCDILMRGDDPNSDMSKHHRERIKEAKELKRGWEKRIEDFGGKMEALIDSIQGRWIS